MSATAPLRLSTEPADPHPAFRATFSHPGEGKGRRAYPRRPDRPYSPSTSSPRGGRPEACWIAGRWCGACGRVCSPLPGGSWTPLRGQYDPCARSSLNGGRTWVKAEGATRRRAELAPKTDIRARAQPETRPTGQKTPRSGAPRGVRMVAQSIRAASWLNGSGYPLAPRGAPLPLPTVADVPRGRWRMSFWRNAAEAYSGGWARQGSSLTWFGPIRSSVPLTTTRSPTLRSSVASVTHSTCGAGASHRPK